MKGFNLTYIHVHGHYDSHIIFIASDCLTGNDSYKLLNQGHYEALPPPPLYTVTLDRIFPPA